MATTKNITMKQYNGTDYDTLYPKTIASQVDGIYSKEDVLSNGTKALYGLADSAVPDDAFEKVGKTNWKLIASFKEAGNVEFVVPNGITEIGVYMVGAGGNGVKISDTYYRWCATGGAAGYGKNVIMQVTPGDKISGIVGSAPSGTTSFNGEIVEGGASANTAKGGSSGGAIIAGGAGGGQGSMAIDYYAKYTSGYNIYGCNAPVFLSIGPTQYLKDGQNMFDPTMITLCAGGGFSGSSGQNINAMPDGTKGGNGSTGSDEADLETIDATGNGNGGGSVGTGTAITREGYGSPGMILIYARGF